MKKQDPFLQRTFTTLTNVLSTPELQRPLAKHNYDLPKIREGMRLHDTVEDLALRLEREQEAQHQTAQLQKAQAELRTWMRQFDEVAQVAFEDQPQREALEQGVHEISLA